MIFRFARRALVYFHYLHEEISSTPGVICATRGNHGQSIAYAAGKYNIPVTIVVPHGNSAEKNTAMQALGAQLVEHGNDFQAALEHAQQLAADQGFWMAPSFNQHLVAGVGTYSMELFRAIRQLDVLYVPIGLGSGICGALAARDALQLSTEIVGVVFKSCPRLRRVFCTAEERRSAGNDEGCRRYGLPKAESAGIGDHLRQSLPHHGSGRP